MKNTSALPADQTDPVAVQITNRRGQRYRYRARDAVLKLRHGMVRVIENDYGCFIACDHCNIEVTDALGRTLFQILNPAFSEHDRSDLTITANLGGTAVA